MLEDLSRHAIVRWFDSRAIYIVWCVQNLGLLIYPRGARRISNYRDSQYADLYLFSVPVIKLLLCYVVAFLNSSSQNALDGSYITSVNIIADRTW